MRNNFMEIERIKRAVGFFVKIKTIRNKHIGGPSYYDLAINALEKQIPKKPTMVFKGEEEYSGVLYVMNLYSMTIVSIADKQLTWNDPFQVKCEVRKGGWK